MTIHKNFFIAIFAIILLLFCVSIVSASLEHQFNKNVDSEYYTPNASYNTGYILQPAIPKESLQGSIPKSNDWK